ncbi:MAG: adenylate/guanylate cyclase domain-containing protein [Chloroflexi bacterium]|nr:adenylate/guanylate cyclase domain-containing protein [Chloroflexota bacterium]
MDPQIRYCTTAEGVSIAYWSIGEGPPIIDMGHPPSHIQMEWQIAPIRAWYERFAGRHQYVRFDTRGTGLSERNVREYTVETQVRDLEAVVAKLRFDTFDLIGSINSSAAAAMYAAHNPARVKRLILWCPYTRGSEFFDDPGTQVLRDMVDRDWHMLTETASRSRFSWKADEHASAYAAMWRAASTPQGQAMLMDSLRNLDVTGDLAAVRAPTLVLQRQDRGPDVARRITDSIPDSALVLFPGGSAAPYLDDADQIWEAIARFLGDAAEPTRPPGAIRSPDSNIVTILFTDVVSNTALLQRLGDERWRALLREHDRIIREQLAAHGGAEIKSMGDGFMASFGSATRALECAIDLQRAFDDLRSAAGDEESGVEVRVGLNAGEPIAENDDLFGTAVTTAARIMARAQGGEILVSDVVRQLVAGKGFLFEDRGETTLRGFEDPVRIFSVRIA